MKCSKKSEAAKAFAEFLISPAATKVFGEYGFTMPAKTSREYKAGKRADAATLRMYAGAGLRRGVGAVIDAFAEETGIVVEGDYGGSGMIITRARLDPQADLFLPGDVAYVERLAEKADLIESTAKVA